MKKLRLTIGLLVGPINHPAGTVVEVPDERAAEMIRHGAARPHEDPAPAPEGPPAPEPRPGPAPARPAKARTTPAAAEKG